MPTKILTLYNFPILQAIILAILVPAFRFKISALLLLDLSLHRYAPKLESRQSHSPFFSFPLRATFRIRADSKIGSSLNVCEMRKVPSSPKMKLLRKFQLLTTAIDNVCAT